MLSNKPLELPYVESSALVLDGFIKVRCDELRHQNDQAYRYYSLIAKSSAVVVLAISSSGLLVLIEEYRHPTGKILLSCPGGYLNGEEEDPCEAARRELLEETGYSAHRFTLMGSAYPYPGISGQKIYYVLAENAKKQDEPRTEATEVLRTVLMSRAQLTKAIEEGRPIDGNMCTALFFNQQP